MPTSQQTAALDATAQATDIETRAAEEHRELTPAESAQVEQLQREAAPASTQTINQPTQTVMPHSTFIQQFREGIATGRRFESVLTREEGPGVASTTHTTTNAIAGALVPDVYQGVIPNLVQATIYQMLGINVLPTRGGRFVWTVAGTAQTKVVGENVAIAPQTISLDKLDARPERLASNCEVTYEALEQSDNMLQQIIFNAIYESAQNAINTILISPTKAEGSGTLQGPFVGLTDKATTIPANFKLKDLVKLKAALLKKGVKLGMMAVVVSPAATASLKPHPRTPAAASCSSRTAGSWGCPYSPTTTSPTITSASVTGVTRPWASPAKCASLSTPTPEPTATPSASSSTLASPPRPSTPTPSPSASSPKHNHRGGAACPLLRLTPAKPWIL